jgi:hypothetical protein
MNGQIPYPIAAIISANLDRRGQRRPDGLSERFHRAHGKRKRTSSENLIVEGPIKDLTERRVRPTTHGLEYRRRRDQAVLFAGTWMTSTSS